ncbi:MAG: hypothetical protein ER33_01025 [Cyanobium sp. CACIAM 14]|nr:MAG: hypothetical protein ER33_01025 [Cyanobium sp. CACIAM 14]
MSGPEARPPGPTALPLTPGRIRREALLTGLAIFAISAGALVVTYRVANESLQIQIRNHLDDVADIAAASLDTRAGGGVLAPGPPDSAAYRRASEPLLRLRRSVPEVTYAYTLVPSPAGFRFGIDTTAFIRNPGDTSPVAQPGELYDDAPAAVAEAFHRGRVVVSTTPYTDKWGTFLSAYAPLRDGAGRIVGLVGVDLSLASLNGFLRPLRIALVVALAGSAALAAAVAFGRWRTLCSQARAFREIAAAEEMARQAAVASEQANRAKSSFLAAMSHELRTPLNAVIGLSDLLLGTSLTPSQRDSLQTLKASGESLLQLLCDLLDVSRLESGALEVQPAACGLRSLLGEEVARLRPQAEARGVALELRADPGLPATVVCDPLRLRQILRHLIGNAIKFSPHGQVRVAASLVPATCDGGGGLVITVRDSGPGLAPELLERLSVPFAQGDASPTRLQEGVGLGLTLSRGLTAALGGALTVVSEGGVGSTFTVLLPLPAAARADAPAAAASVPEPSGAESAVIASSSARPQDPAARRPPLQILIAEDNPVNARVCALMLQRLGYGATVARDGEEAVAAVERRVPDLILMDVRMPHVDGLEATRRIRALRATGPRPWIVAMTANALPSDRAAALESGMDDFLAKPVLLEDLSRALDRARDALRSRRAAAP